MSEDQPDLFTPRRILDGPLPGEKERDEGIEKAEVGAEGWVEKVGVPSLAAMCRMLVNRSLYLQTKLGYVQSAHLEWYIQENELPVPAEKRAYGAVLRAAQKEGWLAPTDTHRPSDIDFVAKQNHRRPMRCWEIVRKNLPPAEGST